MATIHAIEGRLRKLEKARTPPAGVFYLLWGQSPEDLEQGLAAAKAQGVVSRGHRVVRAVWSGSEDAPSPRWVSDTGMASDLTRAEDNGLIYEMERRAADLIKELRDAAEPYREAVEPNPRLNQLTDVQLVLEALGERVR
jgi:hypothetical protein